eukprot:TRINITY_DN36895_c0_g1_i1.p1 TRINITY_DN36895_c0_g1~~TRINITY_DN36895_c0_g1_i1.p1  ORF type:complete len:132 (+),score=38.52 TRINITY_DN36895_c0_g1_i1:755-1150(+)
MELQHKLCDAAKNWDFDRVREMIHANPLLVNVQPCARWSALHQAAAASDTKAVKFLLSQGADKKAKTKDGKTALQVAAGGAVRELLGGKRPREEDESDEESLTDLDGFIVSESEELSLSEDDSEDDYRDDY